MIEPKSTERFTDRVENYVKYRPSYPRAIIPFLASHTGLARAHTIADIGSGTGILSELFLENGNPVFGIEPNAKMRGAGERYLSRFPRFVSVEATAEATTLPASSVDFITAGQAFHWFEPGATRREFARVLRPEGFAILIWNDRKTTDPIGEEYDRLLERYGINYGAINSKNHGNDELVHAFYAGGGSTELQIFPNGQHLDYDALEGRLMSASYAPQAGQPGHEPMIAGLRALFARHQKDGKIWIEYDTKVFWGRLR